MQTNKFIEVMEFQLQSKGKSNELTPSNFQTKYSLKLPITNSNADWVNFKLVNYWLKQIKHPQPSGRYAHVIGFYLIL